MSPSKLIGTIPIAKLIEDWKSQLDIDISSFFGDAWEMRILEDPESRLVTFDPSPVGDASLYENLARHGWYYVYDKSEFSISLRHIEPGDAVLEIGCGRGAFLQKARDKGARVSGVELNPTAAAQATVAGLEVHILDVTEPPETWHDAFDHVVSFQVVEHVPSPFDFCRRVFRLVKPGGKLHVAVPNSDSFIKKLATPLDFPPHHQSRWSRSALEALGSFLRAKECEIKVSPLDSSHIEAFLGAHGRGLGRLAINKFTRQHLASALEKGIGNYVTGHTISAFYTK